MKNEAVAESKSDDDQYGQALKVDELDIITLILQVLFKIPPLLEEIYDQARRREHHLPNLTQHKPHFTSTASLPNIKSLPLLIFRHRLNRLLPKLFLFPFLITHLTTLPLLPVILKIHPISAFTSLSPSITQRHILPTLSLRMDIIASE